MREPWRKRLEGKIKDRGWKWTPLSLRIHKSRTYVKDILGDKGVYPRIDGFLLLCNELRVSPSEILEGDQPARPSVAVVGYASGGEKWDPVDQSTQGAGVDDISLDLSDADPIAIRVRGHSMSPVYRDGDDLICSRMHGVDLQNALNRDCVIKTAEGECYIKTLVKGAARGTYRLRSYNQSFPDLEDVRVEWAAPVMWVRRA